MPRPLPPKESPGLRLIRRTKGLQSKIARILKISRQAVDGWSVIPLNRIIQVEEITGIDREKLRPDIYRLTRKPKKAR